MRTWTLAFLLGVITLQTFPHLPSQNWCALLLIPILLKKFWKPLKLPIAYIAGFFWALIYAHLQSSWTIPETWQGKDLKISGYISSIPQKTDVGTSFLYSMRKINFETTTLNANTQLKLSWRNEKIKLNVGDKYQLTVHLKKTYGTMNPGGFDYEAYAFQEGIRANGYVVDTADNKLLSSHWYHYTLDRIRENIGARIAANLPVSETSPWITALVIAEHHDIDTHEWDVLRKTGTNHLMAIAGLHIGLMAAFAHFIVSAIWRRIPWLTLRIPALYAGAAAALMMALLYSALAGFSLPAKRASLMLCVFLLGLLFRRKMANGVAWCLALLCVLLINPLVVLTESFWLSFGSVALIIYGVSGRLLPKGLWWKWGRIQWVIALGLIPLTLALFQQCSLVAFAANSVSIPVIGFLVVPLSLLGSFLLFIYAPAGALVLLIADKILGVIWRVLVWFSQLPDVVWYQSVPHLWMLLAGVIGMVFLLLPAGFPGRWLGIIWLLPLALYKPQLPAKGEAWLTLLDVGQGLSAVIQTQKHILVFDTGAKMGTHFDMGESVVVPFLHSLQVRTVDMLVISHGDNDHSGGVQAVTSSLPVSVIKSSVPERFTHASYCLSGDAWEWDGVKFTFVYPSTEQLGLGNNSSCVLRITTGTHAIILTGDIEKLAERSLLKDSPEILASDILIAPHHGSKTSAVKHFVAAVHPAYVLFPTGYRNRYHFPHVSVVREYHDLGSIQLNTAYTGAIQFKISATEISAANLYREQHKHYWNN